MEKYKQLTKVEYWVPAVFGAQILLLTDFVSDAGTVPATVPSGFVAPARTQGSWLGNNVTILSTLCGALYHNFVF